MTPKLKFAEGTVEVSIFFGRMEFTDHGFLCVTGEKVLCFHGPLIYEAKALRSMVTKDKQVKYFIHYAGWNKK